MGWGRGQSTAQRPRAGQPRAPEARALRRRAAAAWAGARCAPRPGSPRRSRPVPTRAVSASGGSSVGGHRGYCPRQQLHYDPLGFEAASLATASENQRAEVRHRHQEAYRYFLPIQTRWQDNDQYGHLNNVVYYSYFDTIINQYLIRYCGLKTGLLTSPMVGFMVTNQCTFHTPVSFPQIPVAALAVEKVGRSSVHYRLALFPPKPSKETPSVNHWDLSDGFFLGHPKLAHFASLACTTGSSVHVFVNPATSKPVGLPEDFRRVLLQLLSPASG
ncbi:uncharacterized protein LOC129553672 [Moschus berezovskii]|uniref:uncharacterized protein LOC129553672 n=1 Tax=Moschus berezovskii TaxID=68408 RepID=UPI002444B333|nr:uncharacterized protein LOC129553672 [Moschus berezovskii]